MEFVGQADRCPLCNSERYLNARLRLLCSSKCYHLFCTLCIDRLWGTGVAETCAAPGCSWRLRRADFVPRLYEDMTVQKEVVVRSRVAAVFNRRPPEEGHSKEGAAEWDAYLEKVEDLTFGLLHGSAEEAAAANAQMEAYAAEHATEIAENHRLAKAEAVEVRAREQRLLMQKEWNAKESRSLVRFLSFSFSLTSLWGAHARRRRRRGRRPGWRKSG